MEVGSRTYHTAIIARSLGIPCVVGVGNLMQKVDHGAPLVLDGSEGIIVVNPDRATLREYRAKNADRKSEVRNSSTSGSSRRRRKTGFDCAFKRISSFRKSAQPRRKVARKGSACSDSEWFLTRSGGAFPSEEEQYLVYRKIAAQ